MRARYYIIGGLVAVFSAAIVVLVITTATSHGEHRTNDNSRQPVIVGKAAPHAPPRADETLTGRPGEDHNKPAPPSVGSSGESVDLDDIPAVADLDRKYPGIYKGYQDAFDESRSLARLKKQKRCLRNHPTDLETVEWTAVQTFTVDEKGQAQLTGLELVPSKPGIQPFLDCMSQDEVGKFAFRAPEGSPPTLVVREDSRIMRTSLTAEDVTEGIASMTSQLKGTSLSPGQRAVVEQQLALYQCYAQRGLDHREQCQHDLERD